MQKPTIFKPSTFISGVAAIFAAGTIFVSPACAQQPRASIGQQASPSATQETPPPAPSTKQDSSAASAPAKPAAKTTPEAKHAPAPASKAKSSATAPATKGAATTTSQNAPAKTASQVTGAKTASTAKKGRTSTAKTPLALTLNTQKDKVSYAIGMNVGRAMKRDGIDADTSILLRGINDALADSNPLLTDQEAQTVMTTLQADLRKAQEEKMKQLAEANKKEGDEFLAANKAKEGVVALPSGLQYKILQEGTGPKPTATDNVVVNYRGTLVNGTEFDSSYKRGQPATFPVGGGIIKGWTEALQLMPVGSKWQLFIPSDLAYGPQGRPPMIAPNATLVFEVELASIQPKPAATAAPPTTPAPAPGAAPAPSTPPDSPAPKPTPNPAPPPNPNPAPPNPNPTPNPPNPAPKPPTPTPTPTPNPPKP